MAKNCCAKPWEFSKRAAPARYSVAAFYRGRHEDRMGTHLRRLLEKSPYATNYGTQLLRDDTGVECLTPWADHFTGNPLLQA